MESAGSSALRHPERMQLTAMSTSLLLSFAGAAQEDVVPERGVLVHEEAAFDGFTLFAPLMSLSTFLVDMRGNVVHEWKSEYPTTGAVYLLENGDLLRVARVEENPVFFGGGLGGRIERFDWEGNVTWSYQLSDDFQSQHHDIEPMPNGNVLMIVWEHVFPEDARARGRAPEVVGEKGWWTDAILEVRPLPPSDAELVWEWHAWDHLVQDRDPEALDYGSVPDLPGRIDVNGDHRDQPPMTAEEREREAELLEQMRALGYAGGDATPDEAAAQRDTSPDWLHTNSVDYDPVHDLIVLSTPELNELWILDHSTTTDQAAGSRGGRYGKGGDLLWRWGNPRLYGAGTSADRRLFYQHDPQFIPPGYPGAGNLLVYNNGGERPEGPYSSVDELVLPFDAERGFTRAPGQAFGPAEPVWSYVAAEPESFFSGFISGCQRLPNGNTFVCEGASGRLFEVTPEGRLVWEYVNPHGGEVPPSFGQAAGGPNAGGAGGLNPKAVFRATRVAPDHPGLAGRALGG